MRYSVLVVCVCIVYTRGARGRMTIVGQRQGSRGLRMPTSLNRARGASLSQISVRFPSCVLLRRVQDQHEPSQVQDHVLSTWLRSQRAAARCKRCRCSARILVSAGIGAKGNGRQRHSVPCAPRDLLVGEDLDATRQSAAACRISMHRALVQRLLDGIAVQLTKLWQLLLYS